MFSTSSHVSTGIDGFDTFCKSFAIYIHKSVVYVYMYTNMNGNTYARISHV